jgi:hypothetical protein
VSEAQLITPRQSGVDVTIAIFRDFCQFSEGKGWFFSKTNVIINFLTLTGSRLN